MFSKCPDDDEDGLSYSVSPDINGFSEVDLRSSECAEVFAELFWSDAENADNTEVLSELIEHAVPFSMLRANYDDEECAEITSTPVRFELVVHIDMNTKKEVAFGIATDDNRIAVFR